MPRAQFGGAGETPVPRLVNGIRQPSAVTSPAMHFGAHIYLWTDRWTDESLHILDRARELGLSWVELAAGDDVHFNPELTRRRAESLGLKLTLSPGGLWPADADISHDDPANRQRGLEWHRRAIDLAAACGCVAYCGAIYGHPGTVMRRVPPADELPRTAENLHSLAEYAARRDVLLAIEPMSRFRTHLLNTPQAAMRLIGMAGHPNLRILIDTYHMMTELRDFPAAIVAAAPRLFAIHACENDRGRPGFGLVPWSAILWTLRELRLDVPFFFETYNTAMRQFAHSRGIFGDICPDPDEFVRQGIAFLNSQR